MLAAVQIETAAGNLWAGAAMQENFVAERAVRFVAPRSSAENRILGSRFAGTATVGTVVDFAAPAD